MPHSNFEGTVSTLSTAYPPLAAISIIFFYTLWKINEIKLYEIKYITDHKMLQLSNKVIQLNIVYIRQKSLINLKVYIDLAN